MALPLNQLDTLTFVSFTGDPVPLKQMVEAHARAGVDGTTLARLGKRGTRFTLQSRADYADRKTARSTYAQQYVALIGKDPVDLIWWDISMGGDSFQVVVLDVRPVAIKRMVIASGGLTNGGTGLVIADWDLLAIGYSSA